MKTITKLKMALQISTWAFVLGAGYYVYNDIKQCLYDRGWFTPPTIMQRETPSTGLEKRVHLYDLQLNKEDQKVIR
ncbi:MAG: hypothetical protein Q8L34_02100 [Candidatus Woesearchaeota archaeon]|nr:hypothetical protein [Candidatus Woesearchaeota archaeon]